MKVNEVITEAPIGTNRFSRFLSKTFGAARGDTVAHDAMDQWAEYAKTIERGGTDLTTANYERYLNQWLGKWFGLGHPYQGKLTNFSGPGVNDYIARAVAQFKTGTLAGGEKPEPAAKPEQPAAGSSKKPSGLHPDVSVVSTSPNIILRYKKQDFVLDEPEGGFPTWYRFPTGRQVPKEVRKFLNKQLEQL